MAIAKEIRTLNALLIVGSDTDAGKTVLTCALAAYWQTYCRDRSLGILKPVQSGIGDRELYHRLFGLEQSLEQITPLFYEAPLAPPLAAEREGRKIDFGKAWTAFEELRQQRDWVLVEALGGLGSPVTRETTVADLAWDWRLPAVLVVPVRLGAISQAVANVALARQTRARLKGIVLSCVQPCDAQQIEDWAPARLIQSLTNLPVLGYLPHLTDPTDVEELAQVASNLEIERLLPNCASLLVNQ